MQFRRKYVLYPQSSTWDTPISAPRSLKHEYELYVEHEIEDYKDSISRSALLKIGDEAVAALCNQAQIALTEIVVWQEVDRIIAKRIKLHSYKVWKSRRVKILAQYSKPEFWGLAPDDVMVNALKDSSDRNVLVAGALQEGPAMYLAARGCAVTSVEPHADAVERVVRAAVAAGLGERVRSYCTDLGAWAPDVELHAVVCSPTALAGLSPQDRTRVLEVLQSATVDGGVHLVETIAAGTDSSALDELTSNYRGWAISIERRVGRPEMFMARKQAAVA